MITPDGRIKPWSEMTPEERNLDRLRHFPTMLARWRGGRARHWEYSVSHTTLTIRVVREEVFGNLHITCWADDIKGPVAWENSDVTISHRAEGGLVIEDRGTGVLILDDGGHPRLAS